jgi:hypothetical protein
MAIKVRLSVEIEFCGVDPHLSNIDTAASARILHEHIFGILKSKPQKRL